MSKERGYNLTLKTINILIAFCFVIFTLQGCSTMRSEDRALDDKSVDNKEYLTIENNTNETKRTEINGMYTDTTYEDIETLRAIDIEFISENIYQYGKNIYIISSTSSNTAANEGIRYVFEEIDGNYQLREKSMLLGWKETIVKNEYIVSLYKDSGESKFQVENITNSESTTIVLNQQFDLFDWGISTYSIRYAGWELIDNGNDKGEKFIIYEYNLLTEKVNILYENAESLWSIVNMIFCDDAIALYFFRMNMPYLAVLNDEYDEIIIGDTSRIIKEDNESSNIQYETRLLHYFEEKFYLSSEALRWVPEGRYKTFAINHMGNREELKDYNDFDYVSFFGLGFLYYRNYFMNCVLSDDKTMAEAIRLGEIGDNEVTISVYYNIPKCKPQNVFFAYNSDSKELICYFMVDDKLFLELLPM